MENQKSIHDASMQNVQEEFTRIFGVFDETDLVIFLTILSVSAGIGFIVSLFSGLIGAAVAAIGTFAILLKESIMDENEAVPELCFAIPSRFDKLMPRVIASGRHLLWPIVETVKPKFTYDMKLHTLDLEVPVTTSGHNGDEDNKFTDENSALQKARERLREKSQELVVLLKITIRFRVDPRIKSEKMGVPTFAQVAGDNPRNKLTSTDFDKGLTSKIASELGRFGGLHLYTAFINRRRGIEHYLNSILRLRMPPHVDPLNMLEGFIEDNQETREQLSKFGWSEGSPEIPMENRLKFYEEFSGEIGELLRSEHDVADHSTVELRYGVDLVESTLDEVDYDEQSKQAIQQEMQIAKELEGREHYEVQLLSLMKKLQDEGLSPEDASATAQVLLNLSESKTFNVSGLPDNIGNLLGGS